MSEELDLLREAAECTEGSLRETDVSPQALKSWCDKVVAARQQLIQQAKNGVAYTPSGAESDAQYYVSSPPDRPPPGLQQLLESVQDRLPCWVPHRHVADALGFSHGAIDAAEAACGGRGYR